MTNSRKSELEKQVRYLHKKQDIESNFAAKQTKTWALVATRIIETVFQAVGVESIKLEGLTDSVEEDISSGMLREVISNYIQSDKRLSVLTNPATTVGASLLDIIMKTHMNNLEKTYTPDKTSKRRKHEASKLDGEVATPVPPPQPGPSYVAYPAGVVPPPMMSPPGGGFQLYPQLPAQYYHLPQPLGQKQKEEEELKKKEAEATTREVHERNAGLLKLVEEEKKRNTQLQSAVERQTDLIRRLSDQIQGLYNAQKVNSSMGEEQKNHGPDTPASETVEQDSGHVVRGVGDDHHQVAKEEAETPCPLRLPEVPPVSNTSKLGAAVPYVTRVRHADALQKLNSALGTVVPIMDTIGQNQEAEEERQQQLMELHKEESALSSSLQMMS